MFHRINSSQYQSLTKYLSRVRDLSALGKERILTPGRHPCSSRGSPGVQSSCTSGRDQIGPILVALFTGYSSWLLISRIDKVDVFTLALIPCSVLWLPSAFGFQNHLLKYLPRYLHCLEHEPGAFQLARSRQGRKACCSSASLNQSTT